MIRRVEHDSDSDAAPGGLSRWFAASFVVHIGVVGVLVVLLWTAGLRAKQIGSKVTFIPRGHAQGAFNDPTAAPVVAPPHPEPSPEPPPTAPKQPDPPPKIEEKPKPPEPAPPKPKEEKPKAKPKDTEPPKVKDKAPPKPKEEKKPKDTPKDKTAKTADKKPSKDKPKDQKLAMAQLAPDEEPNPKAKGVVRPQQGKENGEERVGIETHEGEEGPLSGWINLVQRKVENKWLSPEGILIVPDHNSAQIRFTVNRKGELVGQPEVVKEASDPEVAKTGMKAILEAAPLPPLPEDYTESQHEVIITFRLVK